MNSVEFPRYSSPSTLAAALTRAEQPGTVLLGGGTIVYPLLQRSQIAADELVDLFGLSETAGVGQAGDTVVLGAMTTYAQLLGESCVPIPSLLKLAADGVTGGPQLRNQATIGGSACQANPASDVPMVLVALHAELLLVSSARGERRVPAAEFFSGAFETLRLADEVLVTILVPKDRPGEAWGHYKLKTSNGGWPIGVAAACLRPDPTGSGGAVTVTLGALSESPFELPPTQFSDRQVMSTTEETEIRRNVTDSDVRWWSDELADSTYRRRVAGAVAVRAVTAALKEGETNA